MLSLKSSLNWIAKKFTEDNSKMLIWTGVAGWALSSAAQIGAILFNPKIDDKQRSFLVPQEFADAVVNIGLFFLVTQLTKNTVKKMFTTGKFAPESVNKFLKNHKIYTDKIGKVDFNIDKISDMPETVKSSYKACKNFGTTVATIGAGIVASNVITPVIRNKSAARAQKKYIDYKKTSPYSNTYSTGMKI